MRTEDVIQAELSACLSDYRSNAAALTAAQIAAHNVTRKALQQELSACIAEGAVPCPACGVIPHGMIRNDKLPPPMAGLKLYEVGCLGCAPSESGGKRVSFSAQGVTAKMAVERWNKGNFVVDTKTRSVAAVKQ